MKRIITALALAVLATAARADSLTLTIPSCTGIKASILGSTLNIGCAGTPAIVCTPPQVLNGSGTACENPPPVVCTPPKVLNAERTACIDPPVVVPANVKILPKTWDNSYVYTRDIGGFNAGDVIAVRFTTGSIRSSSTDLPHIVAAQWGSPPYDRIAALADQPGLFPDTGGTLNGRAIPPLATQTGQTPTISFSLGVANFWGYPQLELNTTYYLNMKIVPPGDPLQNYDMSVNLVKGAL